jgi:hypothetical protein
MANPTPVSGKYPIQTTNRRLNNMKIFRFKNLAMVGAMSIAGMGLIGVGAHAVFTTSTVSAQTITAGTPHVLLWSADASNGCTTLAIAIANEGTCNGTLPLNPVGPVGSTFVTPASIVYMYNYGSIPVTETSIQIGVTPSSVPADVALFNQVNVCLHSWDNLSGTPAAGWVEARGPLSAAVALTPTVAENPITIAPGQQLWYSMDFYAGTPVSPVPADGGCAATNIAPHGYSDGPNTSIAWYTQVGADYATPPSLTNAAEGGTLATTFTYNYSA